MFKKDKFYVTTPIYYVNGEPHIGSSYTTTAADVLVRFYRMKYGPDRVFFLTGTDEHGAKVAQAADEQGISPQNLVDKNASKFEMAWDELNITHNKFIRTTDNDHKEAVQKALQYMYDKQDIYLGKYEGLYCKGCEQYKNEKDLIDGKCPDHQTVCEKMSEESYMFKLSKYADELIKKIEKDELLIRPIEKKNEILSFYKNQGLEDVSFSRKNVSWGIPIPWDNSHTTYVWADAFLNYLTGLGWDGTAKKEPDFWPAQVQLIGKDIIRVHATIWPAMLLSLGLPLPKQIFVHGFFMVNGQKMSKSLGNVISPDELKHKYSIDGARYLLMDAAPFGHDGDISWEKFDEKYNADLANGIGNFVSRVFSMAEKYFDSIVNITKADKEFNFDFKQLEQNYKDLKIDSNIKLIQDLVKKCDLYISETKPWEVVTKEKEQVEKILASLIKQVVILAWLIRPFMPDSSDSILDQMNLKKQLKNLNFSDIEKGNIFENENIKIKKSQPLFPRLNLKETK